MISAPLRVVSAPKAAVGASFPLPGGSPSVESKPKPGRIKIRCAAAAAAAAAVGSSRGAPAAAPTLYEVLGLRAGATGREIKDAYRRLARERHPDVAPAPGAAAEFVRLHDAYATLSDPDSRARYDRGAVPAVAVAVAQRPWNGGVYGRPRRTWETDQCW